MSVRRLATMPAWFTPPNDSLANPTSTDCAVTPRSLAVKGPEGAPVARADPAGPLGLWARLLPVGDPGAADTGCPTPLAEAGAIVPVAPPGPPCPPPVNREDVGVNPEDVGVNPEDVPALEVAPTAVTAGRVAGGTTVHATNAIT